MKWRAYNKEIQKESIQGGSGSEDAIREWKLTRSPFLRSPCVLPEVFKFAAIACPAQAKSPDRDRAIAFKTKGERKEMEVKLIVNISSWVHTDGDGIFPKKVQKKEQKKEREHSIIVKC